MNHGKNELARYGLEELTGSLTSQVVSSLSDTRCHF